MKLTLQTTYAQTIEVDEETGEQMLNDWGNGDESLVESRFDDARPYGYISQLFQEIDR
jgi:hypothetical protein